MFLDCDYTVTNLHSEQVKNETDFISWLKANEEEVRGHHFDRDDYLLKVVTIELSYD